MTKLRGHKFLGFLLVTLFLLAQLSGSAHAVEYGNAPHKHGGKVCVLSLVAEDDVDDVTILPKSLSLPKPPPRDVFARPVTTKFGFIRTVLARARGPPNL